MNEKSTRSLISFIPSLFLSLSLSVFIENVTRSRQAEEWPFRLSQMHRRFPRRRVSSHASDTRHLENPNISEESGTRALGLDEGSKTNRRGAKEQEFRHGLAYFVRALLSFSALLRLCGRDRRVWGGGEGSGIGTDKCSGNDGKDVSRGCERERKGERKREREMERMGRGARDRACFGTGRVSDIYMRFAY